MEIDRWVKELEELHERIGGCFVRPEPRQRALTYLRPICAGWWGRRFARTAGSWRNRSARQHRRVCSGCCEKHIGMLKPSPGSGQYVKQRFGSTGGVLVVDETPFRKKGTQSAGVKRQYCSTTG